MNSPHDIVAECASAFHQAILKPLGYRKSEFNFLLEGEWTRAINLQLSVSNSAEDVRFTLNFGVDNNVLRKLAEMPPLPAPAKEVDCLVRARYGELTPSGQDFWWTVNSQTDVSELIRDVTGALLSVGLPWLDSLHDYRSMGIEYDRQKVPFMASLAYYLAGELDLARARMKTAVATANSLRKRKVERMAGDLKLI